MIICACRIRKFNIHICALLLAGPQQNCPASSLGLTMCPKPSRKCVAPASRRQGKTSKTTSVGSQPHSQIFIYNRNSQTKLCIRSRIQNGVVRLVPLFRGQKTPNFATFLGEVGKQAMEHIRRFIVQCGERNQNDSNSYICSLYC